MVKIAVIGAGSLVFTRKLVSDLLQQEPTADAEITLMDIDTERLREVGEVVEAIVDQSHSQGSRQAYQRLCRSSARCRLCHEHHRGRGKASRPTRFRHP